MEAKWAAVEQPCVKGQQAATEGGIQDPIDSELHKWRLSGAIPEIFDDNSMIYFKLHRSTFIETAFTLSSSFGTKLNMFLLILSKDAFRH